MRNRYPDICFRCGQRVEPERGEVVRMPYSATSKWVGYQQPMRGDRLFVQHDECADQFNGTARHYLYLPDG